ncbi:phosphonoacetaldehyde reductase, partial [Rhizobium sp. Root482]|uniref:phosphonoacetaldehyde reductase n=2 Tax=Rhizobium sp. Root482 TaxID=1736543 RepID=UPI00138F3260
LDALAQALGHADAQALKKVVAQILKDADIGTYFSKYVKNPTDILKHVSEMITPNRSGNNMRNVDFPDIDLIVRNTLENYMTV